MVDRGVASIHEGEILRRTYEMRLAVSVDHDTGPHFAKLQFSPRESVEGGDSAYDLNQGVSWVVGSSLALSPERFFAKRSTLGQLSQVEQRITVAAPDSTLVSIDEIVASLPSLSFAIASPQGVDGGAVSGVLLIGLEGTPLDKPLVGTVKIKATLLQRGQQLKAEAIFPVVVAAN